MAIRTCRVLVGVLLVAASTASAGRPAASVPSLCDAAVPVAPKLVCAETARGVALAGQRDRAQALLVLAEAGADRFIQRFGKPVARYAVVEGPEQPIGTAEVDALNKAGFVTVLPWLSTAAKREQIESAVRRGVTTKMAGQSPDVIEAAIAQALVQATRSLDPSVNVKVESAAVPHELGHGWYRAMYWPAAGAPGGKAHYGGPGPDWMDETAAVLMEAPTMYDERVVQFGDRYRRYRKDPAAADDATRLLIDLPNFFGETHPALAQVKALQQSDAKDGVATRTVRVLAGAQAEAIAAGAARFYLQSAVGALYLAERTGDPKIFARIGAAFGRGESIEHWLANAEPKGMLPRDLKALQADWLSWLDKRFPDA